ncbi:CPBP family intramembrane glutamic endopeptidase [Halopiger djelfimassiliensis]|uniref:CPBP family intramembrane glutamic endopeptidase n=1 Tax=Halopiger djelfimassiliensis TaxID=1293047 RepID=UPI000677EE0E|nr:CPBP family intramembrane glutamic endopeptidase [Halopiger djelfimassiliensis]
MTRTADETSPIASLAEVPVVTAVTLAIAMGALPALSLADSAVAVSQPQAIVLEWLVAVTVIGSALGVEDLSLSSIGFRRPAWIDLAYLLGTGVAALLIFVFAGPLVQALGLPVEAGTSGLGELPSLPVALASAITTGIVEEVLYRGYAIERLLDYSDSAVVAGGLTLIGFTVVHAVAWPLGNLVQVAAVSALFIAVYIRRRTLVPVAGAHVLVWVVPVFGAFFG